MSTPTNAKIEKDLEILIAGKPKVICLKGMPISCAYRTLKEDCKNEISTCQLQNKCGEDPRIKAQKDKICPSVNKPTAMLDLYQSIKSGSLDADVLNLGKNLDAFRNGGVDKLQKIFPAVIQWMEYYKGGVPFTPEAKASALAAAIYTLQNAEPENFTNKEGKVLELAQTDCHAPFNLSGCTIRPDISSLAKMTDAEAKVTGAHEAIHVVVDKLMGDSQAAWGAWGVEKLVMGAFPEFPQLKKVSVADAKGLLDDTNWLGNMQQREGFTEHVIMEMLKQTFGEEWMVSKGGEYLSDYCKGWTP